MRDTESAKGFRPTRRSFISTLGAFVALMSTTSMTPVSGAGPLPFSFEALTEEMKEKSRHPHVPTNADLPAFMHDLDYDQYRMIEYKTDRTQKIGGFGLHPFHPGWLFKETVDIFRIEGPDASPMDFTVDDFNYWKADVASQAANATLPGVAGFRLNFTLNAPDRFDELVSFLGASYFRALGKDSVYGLSARGLAIDSWRAGPEEFPRFTRFYLCGTGEEMAVYAALESESVTGAYRFTIVPGEDTVMDVTARLFFRKDVDELGVAPLTSMFLYGDINRSDFDDYRPKVHDSDGLAIVRSGGERFWRQLGNPSSLANSYLAQTDIKSFGLHQRDRDFEHYQDAGALYERRPSVDVEPIGDWGPGMVRLIEIPSTSEANDNIVAFWVPSDPVRAGDEREFRYLLRWGNLSGTTDNSIGHVHATRSGNGGFAGSDEAVTSRKFVVDFKGGPLDAFDGSAQLDAFVSVSGGRLVSQALSRIDQQGVWRLAIDVEPVDAQVIELRAYIVGPKDRLTETWLYQWTPVRST